MKEIRVKDAQGVETVVDSSKFQLVQKDKHIHDAKFETKPTTFAKDALKRFAKNKSSVVAAIIIAVLMIFAFGVPMVSQYDLSTPHLHETFLQPKVFEAGTGFWDGTKKYENIIYDPATDAPAGFEKKSVVKILETVDSELANKSQYAHGGIYVLEANKAKKSEGDYKYDYFKHKTAVPFTQENDISIKISFDDDDANFDFDRGERGEYRIVLQRTSDTDNYVVLRDWTKELSDFEYNISDYLVQNNVKTLNGYIRIDVKSNVTTADDKVPSIYFDKITYSTTLEATEENEDLISLLDAISIDDANESKLLEIKDPGYWQTTGSTNVIKTVVTYVTFIYNHYEAKLGLQEGFEIGKTIMNEYIEKGYCEYDFAVGVDSFKKLSEACPIDEVIEQKTVDINGKETTNLVCNVQMYKYLGYKKMPKFIAGTDASGFDLFTRAFSSLRTSLAVAIIIAGICFMFGLVWGSISGYFGGNVDLFMERFCEILGGMPWIVMMTLAIVIWGNTIGTFAIASCITGWMGTAATTRTQFYRFKGREYILSSRTLGSSDTRLIFKHILPNSLGTIVTSSVLKIPGVIFSEATLSYLGLGLQGVASFGTMLSENQSYLVSYPNLIVFPAIIISLLMISFNLFGNGLRDALNPSLKGSD